MFRQFYEAKKDAVNGGFWFSFIWLFIMIGWIAESVMDIITIIGVWTIVMVTVYGLWFTVACIIGICRKIAGKLTTK